MDNETNHSTKSTCKIFEDDLIEKIKYTHKQPNIETIQNFSGYVKV